MSITSAADTSMNAVSPESTAWAAGACASSAGARHRSRALVSRNRRLIGLLVTFLTAENAEITARLGPQPKEETLHRLFGHDVVTRPHQQEQDDGALRDTAPRPH